MSGWRLVSDVGGTNVRFARVKQGQELRERRAYLVSRFRAFPDALRAYLDDTGGKEGCASAAIGAAGRIASGTAKLTNVAWTVSEAEVSSLLDAPCTLINDVEAVAFSLPVLKDTDYISLGIPMSGFAAGQRFLVANIGTGFGAATLIRIAGGWTSCPSEAGHMSLGYRGWPGGGFEEKFNSVEKVLSGPGLSNLRSAIAHDTSVLAPHDVFSLAKEDPHCAAALRFFTEIAGETLGNLVLAVAAWDGVFLCGSVAHGFAEVAGLTLFRKAFEGSGPMSGWKKRIPIALIIKDDAALAGLAALPVGSR